MPAQPRTTEPSTTEPSTTEPSTTERGTTSGSDRESAVLHDPLRSSGGLHESGRLRRGVAEFLRLPLVITLVFCVAGVLVAMADATAHPDAPLHGLAAALVPGEGALDFVSAVATTVVTVTSITFSVLLLAVQQTAGSLTAVVFDQFLRRLSNQVYFGFFVGLSAFAFLVVGLARQDPPPVYGAAITLVLTVVALVALLLLIHGCIDQMRPQSVVRSIHELALRARERELTLLARTRERRATDPDGPHRRVTVQDSGYVIGIDVDRLARVATAAGPRVEVLITGRLGHHLVYGDVAATLAGVDPDDGRWDDEVRAAFALDDIRDVDAEAGYAIEQLENIGWAAASSSQQSPQTAITAVRALRDLLTRWLIAGGRDRLRSQELPVVYADTTVRRLLDSLTVLAIASAESRQAHTFAELLRAFAGIPPRLRDDRQRACYDDALDGALRVVSQHVEVAGLRDALRDLHGVLDECGHDASRAARMCRALADPDRS